jgi:hypothetical protein
MTTDSKLKNIACDCKGCVRKTSVPADQVKPAKYYVCTHCQSKKKYLGKLPKLKHGFKRKFFGEAAGKFGGVNDIPIIDAQIYCECCGKHIPLRAGTVKKATYYVCDYCYAFNDYKHKIPPVTDGYCRSYFHKHFPTYHGVVDATLVKSATSSKLKTFIRTIPQLSNEDWDKQNSPDWLRTHKMVGSTEG